MKQHPFKDDEDRDSAVYLKKLQARINDRNLFGLYLNATPHLAKPLVMDKNALEVYLSRYKSKKHANVVRKFVKTHLRNISMEELQESLRSCVIKLNTKEPDFYRVLVQKYHSQQWIAELAVRHLNELPVSCIEMDSMDFSWNYSGLKGSETLVMFDDCSYTGTQLEDFILPNIYKSLSKSPEKTSVQLYLVIPFITQKAIEKTEKCYLRLQEKFSDQVDLKLDIIHDKILYTISDLQINDVDKPILAEAFGAFNFEKLEKFVMTTTDWKGAPDHVSFIPRLKNCSVPYKLDVYDGWRLDKLPPEIKNMKTFIPKVMCPYSLKFQCENGGSSYQGNQQHTYF